MFHKSFTFTALFAVFLECFLHRKWYKSATLKGIEHERIKKHNSTRNEWIDGRPLNAGIFPRPPRQFHIRFCRHCQKLSSDGTNFHQRSSLAFRKRPKIDISNFKERLCPWQSTEKSETWSWYSPSI